MSAFDPDLDTLLVSMLPKIWSFAFRLTQDECLAEQLVLRACAYWLDHVCYTSQSKSTLVQMLSAIQTIWLADEMGRDDQTPSRHKLRLDFNAKLCERSSSKRHETKRQSPDPIMAVARLPKLPRIVMILIHAEGLTYTEAVEAVGMQVGHIRQLIRQAQLSIASGIAG